MQKHLVFSVAHLASSPVFEDDLKLKKQMNDIFDKINILKRKKIKRVGFEISEEAFLWLNRLIEVLERKQIYFGVGEFPKFVESFRELTKKQEMPTITELSHTFFSYLVVRKLQKSGIVVVPLDDQNLQNKAFEVLSKLENSAYRVENIAEEFIGLSIQRSLSMARKIAEQNIEASFVGTNHAEHLNFFFPGYFEYQRLTPKLSLPSILEQKTHIIFNRVVKEKEEEIKKTLAFLKEKIKDRLQKIKEQKRLKPKKKAKKKRRRPFA